MRNLSGVSTIACQRCRLRKTKCDRNLPKCKSCERANAPCLTTDPTSGRAVPRSYLSHLESRVKELETELSKREDNNLDLGPVAGGSYLGESSGITFSNILGAAFKENLPGARTLQTTPRNPVETSQDIVLPSKPVAEQYLTVYFHEANPQMPILHREAFVRAYFEPVYGRLSPSTNLANDSTKLNLDMALEDPPPGTYYRICVDTGNYAYPSVAIRRCLYFLYSVFAIGVTSCQQDYDEKLAESLHLTAMKYYKIVLSSSDRLEALQGVLLLGLYSVMRPAYPGVWHVVGTAMRMCLELGLHNERRGLKVPASTRDLCRRLFWCVYSLDRQISVYLGRPPGIPDYCARTPFPSSLDDSRIPYSREGKMSEEFEHHPSLEPSYKRVSLAVFKLRRMQGEIQAILYDGQEIPRAFQDTAHWREDMLNRLDSWWEDMNNKLELNNCQFNVNYLKLNYNQSRILLFGVSPGNPVPSESHMPIIAHAGLQIISTYSDIFSTKALNYSWAAVHNIFLAGTSYLYVLYHSQAFRSKTSITELETVVISALEVMDVLSKYCDAAITCHKSFELLSQAILELLRRDKRIDNPSPSSYSDPGDESINSFLNTAAGSRRIPSTEPLSQVSTPLFGAPGSQMSAIPSPITHHANQMIQSPPVSYAASMRLSPAPQQQQGPLIGNGVLGDFSIKEEMSGAEIPAPTMYDENSNVYDFLSDMQQTFIWNNFLNQSSTHPSEPYDDGSTGTGTTPGQSVPGTPGGGPTGLQFY